MMLFNMCYQLLLYLIYQRHKKQTQFLKYGTVSPGVLISIAATVPRLRGTEGAWLQGCYL